MSWYLVKKSLLTASEKISATVIVPDDSPWFSGHFPEKPILPAIAQISIVFEMICRFIKEPMILISLHHVKFKRMISPGEEMEITAARVDEPRRNYSFKIKVNEEIACKGVMHTDVSKA